MLEKDFEDWVCADVARFLDVSSAVLLDRQVRLPTGRIMDVVALDTADQTVPTLYVIELKRDTIDYDAVLQLLAYMGEAKECLDDIAATEVLGAQYITKRAALAINAIPTIKFVQFDVLIASKPIEYFSSTWMLEGTDRERTLAESAKHLSDSIKRAYALEGMSAQGDDYLPFGDK